MKRLPWDILLALILGLGAGLVYAWVLAPQSLTDSAPVTLRDDFKDQFRAAIAAAYAATGNLPRAHARLELIGDGNLSESLNAQAQRELASGQFQQADQLAALALALETGKFIPVQDTPTLAILESVTAEPLIEPTISQLPSPEDIQFVTTESPEPEPIGTPFIPTESVPNTVTPRPTRIPLPTQGAPFRLTALDIVCDAKLPANLLQITVFDSSRRQLPGVKVIVTWDSGEDEFFTGLKPELGNGYADFIMSPGTSYTVQLGLGSEISTEISSPACQAPNGESFDGGYRITFQQP